MNPLKVPPVPTLRGRHPGSPTGPVPRGFGTPARAFGYLPAMPGVPASTGFVRGGNVVGGNYARGGSADTVPAMLTPGEFVVTRKAAQNPENKPLLTRMNREAGGRGYGLGGEVEPAQRRGQEIEAAHRHEPRTPRRESTTQYAKGGTVTIGPEHKGQKKITFHKGGLHRSLGVPEGEKIPATKMAAAKAGRYGPKAKKQASFAMGMLKKGRETAAKSR